MPPEDDAALWAHLFQRRASSFRQRELTAEADLVDLVRDDQNGRPAHVVLGYRELVDRAWPKGGFPGDAEASTHREPLGLPAFRPFRERFDHGNCFLG